MARPDGGYAIKHLAAEYGVEYADALLWIEFMRRLRCREPIRADLNKLFLGAYERIARKIWTRREELRSALVALANARWGEPEPVKVGGS